MAAEEAAPMALNYIPEVVLKKRKNNEEWAIRRKLQLQERVKRLKSEKSAIKKPEQFIREFRDKELDLIQMKCRGRQRRRAPATIDSKLLFIIRIRGKNDMHPNSRKLLYTLRLRKIFNGVLVKANERIMEILQKVEPYVTYGPIARNPFRRFQQCPCRVHAVSSPRPCRVQPCPSRANLASQRTRPSYPNLKTVKDLIYKKGVVRVGKQRIPLTDNNIVEQELGQHNIICIEDIVSEIANVGTHFKAVTNFLCPFVLNNPDKALSGRKKRFKDGGDSGNRGDLINELLGKMN